MRQNYKFAAMLHNAYAIVTKPEVHKQKNPHLLKQGLEYL